MKSFIAGVVLGGVLTYALLKNKNAIAKFKGEKLPKKNDAVDKEEAIPFGVGQNGNVSNAVSAILSKDVIVAPEQVASFVKG